MMLRSQTDLVFGGAGPLRFPIYVGVLKALRDKGYIPEVVDYDYMDRPPRIIGTSAGALVGGLYMSGISITKLEEIVMETDATKFASFSTYKLVNALFWNYWGWGGAYVNSGSKIEKWLEELTEGKTLRETPGLFVVAADVLHDETVILNSESAPDMTVAKAIRASISIPLIFDGVKYQDPQTGRKCMLMDGGIRYNFPIDYFVDLDKTPIVGFSLDNDFTTLGWDYSFFELISMIVSNMISATERKSDEDAHLAATIRLSGGKSQGSSHMKFDANPKERKEWVDKGYETTYSNIDEALQDSVGKIGVAGSSMVNDMVANFSSVSGQLVL